MFTIIVPTHERPLLLRRTLQSLIAQSYRDFKVVVVEDSATHIPPYEELKALDGRCTYVIRGGVKGPAESRNMGLTLADTPYVMFLDDDDSYEPDHLQALAQRIGKGKPELLFCDFKVCNEDRTQNPPLQLSKDMISIDAVDTNSTYIRNRIPNSCLIYRRDIVAKVRYNTELRIYEDWDFLLECLKKRQLVHVPISSVVIHKSEATAPENLRRGNTRDDLIVEVMLEIYKKFAAPNMATRLGRQALMASAGVEVPIERF